MLDLLFRGASIIAGIALWALLFVLLPGCATPAPIPPGALIFGVLGDAPYSEGEVERLDNVIDHMNAEKLEFVVHVGDIGSSALACGDQWLLARKKQFDRIRHPFLLIPGDNEWTDCANPMERLTQWRRHFCGTTLKVEVQQGDFCEHARWEAGGWVFVALNVPGSNNNLRHPEYRPRMAAVMSWLDEAAALAQKRKGLVVMMQANPFVTSPRDGYAELRNRLAALASRSPGQIILVHGDTHLYRDDEPLPGLRRIEVWGSPFVDWTRLTL